VRRGEKATLVVFWKFANDSADSQDDEQISNHGSRLLFTPGYSVFNAAQVDGYAAKPDADAPIEQRIASAEQFFSGINARVIHLGIRAFYSPCR
jgi:antirestriction protein ArdC